MDTRVVGYSVGRLVLALVASSSPELSLPEQVLSEVHETSLRQPDLTPRSLDVLRQVAQSGDLITLWSDGSLAGWGVRETLAPGLKEVGLMFVKEHYRSAPAFSELTRELGNDDAALIFASYDPALIRFVIAKHGFKPVSLFKVALVSRGAFIAKRLGKATRKAVREHTNRAKPLFAMREAR